MTEPGVLLEDGIHEVDCIDEGRHIDLIKIQAPDAMHATFDTGEGVDAEFGLSFDVAPWDHRDVLLERTNVDNGLNKLHALFEGACIDEIGEEICLSKASATTKEERMIGKVISTYPSKSLVIRDGNINGKGFRHFAGVGTRKFVQRCVLAGMEPEIGVHSHAVVGVIEDLINRACDNAKIEACSTHAPV